MQPLRMTIRGTYWDSQVYSGKLYLFSREGSLRTIDWDRLVESLKVPQELGLAMHCAFLRSDYFYGNQWNMLFEDKEVKSLIQSKFSRLAERDILVSEQIVGECTLATQDSPFPFPHADTTVYRNVLYAASRSGIFRSSCRRKKQAIIVGNAEKIWDCPMLSISASYNTLALAAGDDGLFELEINKDEGVPDKNAEPKEITKKNCTAANWLYFSTYGSSHVGDGFLADFKMIERKRQSDIARDWIGPNVRKLEKIVTAQKIFLEKGYSWGTKDKICQATNSRVEVVQYNPWKETDEERLRPLGTIQLQPWKGKVISGGIALLGTIIECENAIVVVPSEGDPITLPGEPVNWRVFPRSKYYENTLHIVYEDSLEIYSFNHDYFVDQKTKRSGIRFAESRRGGGFQGR